MQNIMLFETNQVEIMEIHSIIYFNPYHVGKCLGLTDSAVRKAIAKMTNNQVTKLTNAIVKDIHNCKLPPSGKLFLTESGVYKLAFKSNKPNAEAFTNWVADEVLPTISKTGRYELQQQPNTQELPDIIPILEPAVQYLFREIVKQSGQIYSLKQENKAIRAALNLHYKEHNPEAYSKPVSNKSKPAKPAITYFKNIELLFNDMKDQYQSFVTSETINAVGGSPMIKNTMVFRLVEIEENKLHFQVNKHNTASMDIYNVTKAEKTITDDRRVVQYKVYCKENAEPIILQAVPKR